MCGIFGHYIFQVPRPRREILDTLFAGLHRLEYRGYDSAGIAIDSDDAVKANNKASGLGRKGLACIDVHANAATDLGPLHERVTNVETEQRLLGKHKRDLVPRPILFKASGKVDALVASTREQAEHTGLDLDRVLTAHSGIAHTRWATHGAPSPINAHPHASGPLGEFVVVHNGIITNYRTLREFLKSHGDMFVSDTDTEVVPKLCSYVYKKLHSNATKADVASKEEASRASFCDVVVEVMAKLEGAFALLIKSTHYHGELVACKRGSPLIMGIKAAPVHFSPIKRSVSNDDRDSMGAMEDDALECFIASDASAFVEHTKKVVVLEDDDVLHLCRGAYGIYSASAGRKENLSAEAVSLVRRQLSTLDMEVASIMKGGYDHYMRRRFTSNPTRSCRRCEGGSLLLRRAPAAATRTWNTGSSWGGSRTICRPCAAPAASCSWGAARHSTPA